MSLDTRIEAGARERADVEPLSEARWAKIEGALFKELDLQNEHEPRVAMPHFIEVPPMARWRAGAAFVVAGAVAAAIGALVTRAVWNPEPPPAITSQVETGASGTHLVLGEAALDVGPETALVVNGDDTRGVLVVLERGRVEFEVAPRHGRPSFIVQAGEARVRVTGTHFSVERDRMPGSARVEVASGSVEVSTPGEIVNLRAGEHWPREDKALSALSPPSDPAQSEEAPATLRPAQIGRRSNGPPASRESRTPEVDPRDFVSSAERAANESPPPRAETASPAPESRTNGARADGAPANGASSQGGAPPSALTRRGLFESAARLESSNPATALAQYAELARGTDPWAANALYASGRLQADHRMPDAAQRTLEEYLGRFPRGANAADARDLLNRLKGKPKLR